MEAVDGFSMGDGEAGIALSLLLAASVTGPFFDDEAVGRAVLAALLDAVVRIVAFVVGFTADFVGSEAALRLVMGFFALVIGGPMLTRFVVGGEPDFGTGALTDALGAIDTLFAGPLVISFLVLSTESERGLVLSSIELVDSLDLCPVLAAVAALTACAGLLGTDPVVGRVGGLLRVLPDAVRVVEDTAGFVAGVGAELKGRVVVAVVRFGGSPFLRGEVGDSWRVSLIRCESTEEMDCFLLDIDSPRTSCAGACSGEAASAIPVGSKSDASDPGS